MRVRAGVRQDVKFRLPRTGLRERIDIQRAARTTSEGERTLTWPPDGGSVVADQVPAHVRWETAGERLRGGRLEARQACIVTIRYRSDVLSTDRIAWRREGLTDEILQITGTPTDPDGRRQWLRLECLRTDTDATPS